MVLLLASLGGSGCRTAGEQPATVQQEVVRRPGREAVARVDSIEFGELIDNMTDGSVILSNGIHITLLAPESLRGSKLTLYSFTHPFTGDRRIEAGDTLAFFFPYIKGEDQWDLDRPEMKEHYLQKLEMDQVYLESLVDLRYVEEQDPPAFPLTSRR